MVEEVLMGGPQESFQDFLKLDKYRERISQMALAGETSFIVDFEDLITVDSALAERILEKPDEYLKHANQAAYAQLQIEEPEYAEKTESVTVRFRGLPQPMSLRHLGAEHIGRLVMVEGIIIRATPARPMVTRAAFKCKRCGEISYRDQATPFLRAPFACDSPSCRRKGPFDFLQEMSEFIDSQEIRIQERP